MTEAATTILVVDDHEAGRYARAQVLRRAGYNIVEAGTGTEALALVARLHPRLVVLDVQLPDMSGLDVCRRIKGDARTSVIPVLHMSATSVTEPDQVRGLEGGADGYLVEPIAPEVIVATVKALLRMRAAEDDLRESRRAMAALISNLPGMAYRRRASDWRMSFVSEGARELTGYTPRELLSGEIPWLRLIHPDDLARVKIEAEMAARDSTPLESSYRIIAQDGTIKWVWDRATPIVPSSGPIEDWEGFATDITERRRAHEAMSRQREQLVEVVRERTSELERSHEKLRISERMASLGALSAGIGHDIANLLLPMRCHLDVIEEQEQPSEDIRAIRASVDYLQNLVAGVRLLVLDPEGGAAAPGAATAIGEWWRTVQPLVKSVLPRHVELEHDVPEGLPPVTVAGAALTQAVFNLVQNAGDALRDRSAGRVRVWAEAARGPAGEPRVRIGVADDGPGMSEETRRRCLEPFFSTKPRERSTGLGLAMVHGVVTRAGGVIDIQSAPGAGATIILSLPAAAAAGVRGAVQSGAEDVAVVSIGDERLSGFAAAVLESEGLRVRRATRPEADARLWVVESREHVGEAASEFLRSGPSRQVVILGGRGEQRSGGGVIHVPEGLQPSVLATELRRYAREGRERGANGGAPGSPG